MNHNFWPTLCRRPLKSSWLIWLKKNDIAGRTMNSIIWRWWHWAPMPSCYLREMNHFGRRHFVGQWSCHVLTRLTTYDSRWVMLNSTLMLTAHSTETVSCSISKNQWKGLADITLSAIETAMFSRCELIMITDELFWVRHWCWQSIGLRLPTGRMTS